MGRKKLNRSKDELDKMNTRRSMKYYHKNREIILKKRMERYWEDKSK